MTKTVQITLVSLLTFACGGNIEDSASSGGYSNNAGAGVTVPRALGGATYAYGQTTAAFPGLGGTHGSSGGTTSVRQSSLGGVTGTGGMRTGGTTSTGGKLAMGGKSAMGGAAIGGTPSVVGGKPGTGGVTSSASTLVPLTGGLDTPERFYDNGDFYGPIWVASDADTAQRTDVEHSNATLAIDEMCITGKAPKIPLKVNPSSTADYDYSEIWGLDLGWSLNQTLAEDGGGAGPQNPANFSDVTSVTVNLAGATGLNMRVQLETRDNSGASTFYCATLPITGSPTTIDIRTLRANCWQSGGTAFDPSTMQPFTFAFQIVTSSTKEYPINFCVTELEFNTAGDAG